MSSVRVDFTDHLRGFVLCRRFPTIYFERELVLRAMCELMGDISPGFFHVEYENLFIDGIVSWCFGKREVVRVEKEEILRESFDRLEPEMRRRMMSISTPAVIEMGRDREGRRFRGELSFHEI